MRNDLKKIKMLKNSLEDINEKVGNKIETKFKNLKIRIK
jgi:hypothetical protein